MTRTYTKKPVWTWVCDECFVEVDLGRTQNHLPSPDEMRERGWFIAELFGDKCPTCVAKAGEGNE